MEPGEKIKLANQEVEVVKCQDSDCSHMMVNLDADQLAPGDLTTLKLAGVRISNPETDKPICINCEYKTFGKRIADFFESDDEDDDDDDSSFFRPSSPSGPSIFGGHSSFGGFGGGFGGFGGGGFGGAGASRGF